MRVHVYDKDPDGGPDIDDGYLCRCGLPKKNVVHKLPERSDEQRAAEARRVGERA